MEYKGTIIEESLVDNRILNKFKLIKFKITEDQNPSERWHLYTVLASEKNMDELQRNILPGKWYIHFWDDSSNPIILFRDKKFYINSGDQKSRQEAVEYGKLIGIPEEQLDFVIENQ